MSNDCFKRVVKRMIGIRAHDVGTMPVRELAKEIAKRGFSAHLALQKAITDFDCPRKLNREWQTN